MKKKDKLEIKLKEIKPITNMSYMFNEDHLFPYNNLILLPDISKWDTKNVTNMSICLTDVINYHHYQIFLNGILKMLLI